MIHSMTGFANASGETENAFIHIELRAVNHRYLDIQFKLPDELRHLESILREQANTCLKRGKIECRLGIQNKPNQTQAFNYNVLLAGQLAQANKTLLNQYPDIAPLTVADILRFPGVMSDENNDQDALHEAISKLFNTALTDFNQSRLREGEKLKSHIMERLRAMSEIIASLENRLPDIIDQHLKKAEERLKTALENIEDDRVKQEFVIFMQKSDVDEEMSRLKAHISEVERTLNQNGSIGKRLDFLMQELNREANTLGSKSVSSESTLASVELKVLIEQMREQVQNIE